MAFFAWLRAHPQAGGITVFVVEALAVGSWQSWLWWEAHKPRIFVYNPVLGNHHLRVLDDHGRSAEIGVRVY